jgi:phosphatidylglycerophosphatase A
MKIYHATIRFLAAGLGLGYAPIAPGTFGTVLGSIIFYFIRNQSQDWILDFTLGAAAISIVIAHLAEKSYGTKDCQKIVIDEVAGVLFTYMFVDYSVVNLVLGFLFFRFFDVAKIFPARWVQDHFKGGLGVVADDLVAGLQGGALLYALPWLVKFVSDLTR